MTIDEILLKIRAFRPCSKSQLHRYLKQLGIVPMGAIRQRPAHYPPDTANKLIDGLGFVEPAPAILSMSELKAVRTRAKHKRKDHAPAEH